MLKQDYVITLNRIATTQQSMPAKPVDEGYAVTKADTVVCKDKKKGKKVWSFFIHICTLYTYINMYVCTVVWGKNGIKKMV